MLMYIYTEMLVDPLVSIVPLCWISGFTPPNA